MGYRPYLDGLRAIAVYLVAIFHAAEPFLPGGFIGVDVFFVLSGYLVTQVLLRDIAERGSLRFGRFYARRFRRLFPAAFVTLLSTAAMYAVVASPPEVLDAVASFRAAFLYSANWYFIVQSSSYFGIDPAINPVLHFWSLAVEEQFYFLWPLALATLFALTSRRGRAPLMPVRIIVAVLTLVSLARAVMLRADNPGWAYYGTDARAYQLLAGATLALTPALVGSVRRFQRVTHMAAFVAVAALLGTASTLIDIDPIVRGAVTTLTTCVLILTLEASDGGVIRRVLSTDLMVYLGKISYGTYLWHWPVLLVASKIAELTPFPRVMAAVVLASALASLSAAILELPIRESRLLDRYSRSVVASGLATSVVAALVLIPSVMTPSAVTAPSIATTVAVGTVLKPSELDWRSARWNGGVFPSCYGQPLDRCTLVNGDGRHVLLMGDSHAQSWVPTFMEIARRENLTFSVSNRGACPWQRDLFRTETIFAGMPVRPEDCKKYKDDLYDRVIPGLDPDVIVVAQAPYEDPDQDAPFLDRGFGRLSSDPAAYGAALEKATAQSLALLRAGGSEVLIIEPIPVASKLGRDPLQCVASAKSLEECRYIVNPKPSVLDQVYRALAKQDPGVHSADFDRLVCPYLPICDPVVNGQIVKWDRTHLTTKFAESLAGAVDAYMQAAALLPRSPAATPAAANGSPTSP